MLTISSILELSAAKYPDRPALIYPAKYQRFTYREWNDQVNRMANGLLKLGIAKGDRVSTFLGNTGELVSTLFATARVGAVANPINCQLSPAELAFILNDAESRALVYGADERERVLKARAKIKTVEHFIYVDEQPPDYTVPYYQLLQEQPDYRPQAQVLENDWYSIIYTSGTTGKHKGVIHRHRDIVEHSMCMIATQQLTYQDRGLSVAPLYHSAELHCFFMPRVHAGAANIIHKTFSTQSVFQVLEIEKITVMYADPSRWKALVEQVGQRRLPWFRLLMSGGAPMPPDLTVQCQQSLQTKMIHYYGMTEMGPVISVLLPHEQADKLGSVGKPLINHDIRVVRMDDVYPSQPEDIVEAGHKGEIIVRGTGMMQGYYNRPEMTARVLYGGWYHTGDIGYIDREGYLWLVDRYDDCIFWGVDNIYPREIEEVLIEHPDIQEAAVVGVDSWRGIEITAFIVSNNISLTAGDIEVFLRESDKLAHFKIPGAYKFVSELPRGTTGKVQRRLLAKRIKKTIR
ncbi:long-chain-fatty-acid--CoA ligase [Desulfoscipio sp. XC116]|uniref:long-chain-fatty-acid--CoA ligase n=1 Tax=Desulfoscipio sp. XC116 TaxID=3144975 RepID=UPI00325A45AD